MLFFSYKISIFVVSICLSSLLELLAVVRPTGVYLFDFFCSGIELLSPYLCFISFLYLDLYVLGDDAWIS